MAVKEVLRMGHPVLRQKAAPVSLGKLGSKWIQSLVTDLQDTLESVGGIGLAAPQIGVSYRVAIIRISGGPTRYGELSPVPLTVYINPTLKVLDEASQGFVEGCLSVPGLRGYVERPRRIRLHFRDLAGNSQEAEYSGFLATVFQHEFDHLDGLLFVDRMTNMTRLYFEDEFNRFHAGPPNH